MTHIYHADLGDPARPAILVDDCEDCELSAQYPVQRLDRTFTAALWRRMLDVEYGRADRTHDHYRSHAEVAACAQLRGVAMFLELFTNIDPRDLLQPIGFDPYDRAT